MNNTQLPTMLHHRTLSNLSSHAHDEDLFSSITGLDDLAGVNGGGSLDDDLSFDDNDDSLMDSKGASSGGPARKGKNRNNSSSTAEKKATHNAVERARRESLNARFLVLADMLPGMTQVKRASKAAIVNKSIDLIREMQLNEQKLARENEQLKLELEALRVRTGSPASSVKAASAPASGNANIAALAAAQEAARQQIQAQANAGASAAQSTTNTMQQQQQQSLFAAAAAAGMQPHHMHHLAAGMPMMPHMQNAAAMAQIAAVAAASNPAALLQQQQQQAHSNVSAAAAQQQAAAVQQFHASQAALAAAAVSAQNSSAAGEIGSQLFPGSGFFSGLFNAGGAFDTLESARSESGSPASHGSFGSQGSAANAPFAHGLFDLPAMTAFTNDNAKSTGSPTASSAGGYNQSPPGTVASLASERTQQSQTSSGTASSATSAALTHNGSAPSPASSNGVPTPSSNAYSPIGLLHITATPQSSHSQALGGNTNNGLTDPVIAAFDGSSDAAYLAAQFAPNDLAKAQHDLQAFIAYQQRMAFAPSSAAAQGPHTPTLEHGRQASAGAGSPSLYPPSSAGSQNYGFPQHHMQAQLPSSFGAGGNASLVAGMCGPSAQAGMNGMPAWQMMMAQHQAMVAAYGGQQF